MTGTKKRLAASLMFEKDSGLTECYNRLADIAPEQATIMPRQALHITLDELKIPKKQSYASLAEHLREIEFEPFEISISDFIDTARIIPNKKYRQFPVYLRPDSASNFECQGLRLKLVEKLRHKGFINSTQRKPLRAGTYSMPHMKIMSFPVDGDEKAMQDFLNKASKIDMPKLSVNAFYLASKISWDNELHPSQNDDGEGIAYRIEEKFPALSR